LRIAGAWSVISRKEWASHEFSNHSRPLISKSTDEFWSWKASRGRKAWVCMLLAVQRNVVRSAGFQPARPAMTMQARCLRSGFVTTLRCTVSRTITVVRGMFRGAEESGLLEHTPRWSRAFDEPTANYGRREKARRARENGRNIFTAHAVETLKGGHGRSHDQRGL